VSKTNFYSLDGIASGFQGNLSEFRSAEAGGLVSGGDDWPLDNPTTSSNVYFNRDIFSPYYIRAEERLAAGQDNATNFNGSWHGSFLDGDAKRRSSTILGKDFKYGGDYA
jgi:hypothetical protein